MKTGVATGYRGVPPGYCPACKRHGFKKEVRPMPGFEEIWKYDWIVVLYACGLHQWATPLVR
jgi:hypothetical protein